MTERVQKPEYCHIIGTLMAAHGESQNDLAAAIGVNRDKVNNWFRVKAKLDAENLLKIADHYGVTADYILGRAKEATDDWDLEKVCEYTGLTKYAVEFLHLLAMNVEGNVERSFVRTFIDGILDSEDIRSTVRAICNSARAAADTWNDETPARMREIQAETKNTISDLRKDKDGLYVIDSVAASVFYRQCAIDSFKGRCIYVIDSLIDETERQYRDFPAIDVRFLTEEEREALENGSEE